MAGGIDWFRWHHGSVTDPKFQLIARKANARLGDVITVWAFVLEKASADADRGTIGELDFETLDFLLGAEEGTAARILDAMTARGLIVGSRIAKWEDRQPKRERDGDSSTERVRAFRQRQQELGNASETPRNASEAKETSREEERRGELSSSLRSEEARKRATTPECPEDVSKQTWADWLQLRRQKKAPVTETVLQGARSEAEKAQMPLERFLAVWCMRGTQGLQADWLKPHERGSPSEPSKPGKHSGFDRKNYREGVTEDGSLV
jgi:hypothetical protein